jgi:glycosyltransferase involved in cell wall biosynthesis
VVDPLAFPFIPQCRRESGLLVAFPRKGATFIRETSRCYQDQGGRFWRFELLDGLPFRRLAEEFRRPQAFLASADVEGCALPPQEAMAAGIVVVGKDASGANFCMRHGETAFVASTPAETAACLREIEDDALRQRLADNAYAYISRFFPWEEPVRTWRRFLASLATLGPAAHRLGSDPTSPSSV